MDFRNYQVIVNLGLVRESFVGIWRCDVEEIIESDCRMVAHGFGSGRIGNGIYD